MFAIFRKPTAFEMATQELQEARSQLLNAYTAMEFAQSQVAYNKQRIERLEAFAGNTTVSTNVVVAPAKPKPVKTKAAKPGSTGLHWFSRTKTVAAEKAPSAAEKATA